MLSTRKAATQKLPFICAAPKESFKLCSQSSSSEVFRGLLSHDCLESSQHSRSPCVLWANSLPQMQPAGWVESTGLPADSQRAFDCESSTQQPSFRPAAAAVVGYSRAGSCLARIQASTQLSIQELHDCRVQTIFFLCSRSTCLSFILLLS